MEAFGLSRATSPHPPPQHWAFQSTENTRSILLINNTFSFWLCCRPALVNGPIYTLHDMGPSPQFPVSNVIDTGHLNSSIKTYKFTMSCCHHCPRCLGFTKTHFIHSREYTRMFWSHGVCRNPRIVFRNLPFSFNVGSGYQIQVSQAVTH